MLYKKIEIDYLLNIDFNLKDLYEIARLIFYLASFTKITILFKFDDIWQIIFKCIINNLLLLPDDPKDISSYINDTLSFKLPLTNYYDTCRVIRVLCKVFTFQTLPETYFKNNHLPLPEKIEDLHFEIRDLFPISSHTDLKQLSNYKKALQNTIYILEYFLIFLIYLSNYHFC